MFLAAFAVTGQDKIYLLNGDCYKGKILEIAPEEILVDLLDEKKTLNREDVLLIEYKNGIVELYSKPKKNIVKASEGRDPALRIHDKELLALNYTSLNTLALCNADIAGTYERLLPERKMGIGAMGAYNFNVNATFNNFFIAVLNNAKKNYDLGVFVNKYAGSLERKTILYYGILFKYTDFSFMSVTEETVNVGGAVSVTTKFKPSKGSQLATIITIGTHTSITKNFFIKTVLGLGGFNMRGVYRQQFNYIIDQSSNTSSNYGFLPKTYLGLNAGFNF
jgi:hypothetical protein